MRIFYYNLSLFFLFIGCGNSTQQNDPIPVHESFTIDSKKAYCVSSAQVEAFLEESLKKLGLNEKERNDFIVYWLPIMESNPYNVVQFMTKEYTDGAKLNISPKPDSLIRVFMVFKSSLTSIKVGAPKIKPVTRK